MRDNKGFTLLEMLIVVAIIAILIAIAVPTFAKQLEKAREATDLSNLRSAYSEMMMMVLTDEPTSDKVERTKTGYRTYVRGVSRNSGWQTAGLEKNKSGYVAIGTGYCPSPHKDKPVIRVTYTTATDTVTFTRMNSSGYGASAIFFN